MIANERIREPVYGGDVGKFGDDLTRPRSVGLPVQGQFARRLVQFFPERIHPLRAATADLGLDLRGWQHLKAQTGGLAIAKGGKAADVAPDAMLQLAHVQGGIIVKHDPYGVGAAKGGAADRRGKVEQQLQTCPGMGNLDVNDAIGRGVGFGRVRRNRRRFGGGFRNMFGLFRRILCWRLIGLWRKQVRYHPGAVFPEPDVKAGRQVQIDAGLGAVHGAADGNQAARHVGPDAGKVGDGRAVKHQLRVAAILADAVPDRLGPVKGNAGIIAGLRGAHPERQGRGGLRRLVPGCGLGLGLFLARLGLLAFAQRPRRGDGGRLDMAAGRHQVDRKYIVGL